MTIAVRFCFVTPLDHHNSPKKNWYSGVIIAMHTINRHRIECQLVFLILLVLFHFIHSITVITLHLHWAKIQVKYITFKIPLPSISAWTVARSVSHGANGLIYLLAWTINSPLLTGDKMQKKQNFPKTLSLRHLHYFIIDMVMGSVLE